MRSQTFIRRLSGTAAVAILLSGAACNARTEGAAAPGTPEVSASPPAPRAEATPAAAATSATRMVVYKTPTCGCCRAWVDHMQAAGFAVEVHDLPDVSAIKREHGVPAHLGSCHTAIVGGYVVEGHVPAATIRRLLAERPQIAGIAVPGMPIGSPGMESGSTRQPYDVIAFTPEGRQSLFESH